MKKTKDVSDEDEYSADDPEEMEGASEEEWTPEAGAEVSPRYRCFPLSSCLENMPSHFPINRNLLPSSYGTRRDSLAHGNVYAPLFVAKDLSIGIVLIRIPYIFPRAPS